MTVHEDASVPANAVARPEGIKPNEILQLFVRQWRWAVAAFVIVAGIAIVPLSRIKPQWEAQATIHIGMVYDALAGSPRLVESLQEVQERMRIKSFPQEALKQSGPSSDAASESAPLSGVRIDPVPSTGLIRITVRAPAADEATHALTAIVDGLKSVHGELTQAARSEVELLAQQYATELASLRGVQSNLLKAFSSASNSGVEDGSAAVASAASAMERNAREIREIDHQRFLLLRRDKYQSSPTEMIGRISSVRIGGASRGLIIFFGIVMGLAAGLVCALLRDYVSRRRSQPLSG
ncbi:hypothetical protein XH99_10890 [Bradyrhizobium nanningense]|uniref:Polysaccharide chain length determinant N-terminal domain-containing protein n=1 Tax=Bradyrhizobium nanningense TaxID=1325118 RepID=A0A4Q0S5X5_9BRAD|nr:hypothetical protein [Bradyrhizobium nanningense]RXH29759.1 hypothetical protein XH84_20745 [Bradyrhizobium nanningense]RXH31439.1 hypothetical protein XH99_10890 [Bradyrhizobium nanningense]